VRLLRACSSHGRISRLPVNVGILSAFQDVT
jgi:hypothetical protein